MSEMKTVPGIRDVIKSITSNRESGRLEINSSGTFGTLLFNEGKLVDARLGSLNGFQAVNAAVALREVQFSFDHVMPASHSSTITPNERVVLKRFFGIEAAEMEQPGDKGEPNPDWNTTPEQVVPLTEVEEIPQTDLEDTPTVEVEPPVRSRSIAGARAFAYLLRPRLAVSLALLLGLAVGAIALRSKMKARQQSASVAAVVESKSSSVPDSQQEVKQVAGESPSVTVSQQQNTRVRSGSPSPAVSAARRESDDRDPNVEERDAKVQDLTGEWRVINTVEKTAYKSFDNLEVGFRLKINQRGKQFTASGEKFSENGQTLPANNRTPIHLTGSIDGDRVVATFVEDGRMRRTNGRFVWRLQSSGDGLAGTFVSTAANSRGKSAVIRQ